MVLWEAHDINMRSPACSPPHRTPGNMTSPPPLSAQRPRPRHHVVPISVPPRIHPAHARRSAHQVPYPYPPSAFPAHAHHNAQQHVFFDPYLGPALGPLPMMPLPTPLASRLGSTIFSLGRPPPSVAAAAAAAAFIHPGHHPTVHHIHHHHYHHRFSSPSASAGAPFPRAEGLGPPYPNASGRAFPSRQAWERHAASQNAGMASLQVFDPDGCPIVDDSEDDGGPVIVDADGDGHGAMDMVLHRPPLNRVYGTKRAEPEPRMQEEQGGIIQPSIASHTGDTYLSSSISSIRPADVEVDPQFATNGMETNASRKDCSFMDRRHSAHSIIIETSPTRPRDQGRHVHENSELRDTADDEAEGVQETHNDQTQSLHERKTPAVSDHPEAGQRRTQSLHGERLLAAPSPVSNATASPPRYQASATGADTSKNTSTPTCSAADTASPTSRSTTSHPPHVAVSDMSDRVAAASPTLATASIHSPTSGEMIDRLLCTTGLNARQFMRMLEDQTFVLDVERYQERGETQTNAPPGSGRERSVHGPR